MQQIQMLRWSDMHCHLRQGELLKAVLPYSNIYRYVVVMPNVPEILTGEAASDYLRAILSFGAKFEPLMTIKITPTTTPEIIREAHNLGVIAGKIYPEGVTTGSENGVTDFRSLYPLFDTMSSVGMICCIHGEMPNVPIETAEQMFIPKFQHIVNTFPHLKIVFEHISTACGVGAIESCGTNVAATITPHHLLLTTKDVLEHPGNIYHPHNFCKPVAKTEEDRNALLNVATSGDPRFFLGTDFAPHEVGTKKLPNPMAGISNPCAPLLLAEIFEERGKLEMLEGFASLYGPHFYGLAPPTELVTLRKEAFQMPQEISWKSSDGQLKKIIPFRAGEMLTWNIAA